jgi:phosphatidylglycerophosphate synthase
MNGPPWDQRLARVLVGPLKRTPVHPNHLTTIGLTLGLTAAVLFAQGDPGLADWAALLFMAAIFMDHADGELARLAGKTSSFGHYYDHATAVTNYVALFVGIGIGLERSVLGGWAAPMGILAGLSVGASFAGRLYIEERFGKELVQQENFAGFEMEDTLYIVGPVTWLGGLVPFLIAACIGAPLFLLFVLWQIRKRGRLTAGGRS